MNDVHKCDICGLIIETLHGGGGTLVCCGQPMKLVEENTTDAAQEKHVPVIKDDEKGKRITVGEVEHPMTEEHHIEWIEVIFADGRVLRKNLKPGDDPSIYCSKDHSSDKIRAYCNLHGLWKN